MLVCKKKYFGDRWQDYNDFSSYLANDVFFRLRSERLGEIKSVLNYAKSIMNFRKMRYCEETFSEVIDINKPQYYNFNDELFRDMYKNKLESYNHKNVEIHISEILVDLPNIIKANISKVYKYPNRKIYDNIYISCLLTMINKITLPNKKNEVLNSRLAISSKFDDVDYIHINKGDKVILWHLQPELESLVSIIVNRSRNDIIDEIKEAIDENKIGDDEYSSILATGFFGEANDD